MVRKNPGFPWAVVLVCALAAVPALAQTPVGAAFTYQGRLTVGGSPASGAYDLRFILYNADVGGSQVGSIVTLSNVTVTSGLFTVSLDFGSSAFAGEKRWLEIAARPGGSGGAFTPLSPRQELTPVPQATFSLATGDTTVQRRTVAPTCPAGQYLQSLAADGTPTCVSDANSGGTVTSVATGAGLTGGPITGTGTIAADLTAAGGANGTGTTVARGDHTHFGQGWSGAGTGLGVTAGDAFALRGETTSAAANAAGVFGLASSTTGGNAGVWGESSSTIGVGTYGLSTATTGPAYAVLGESYSSGGAGVFGYSASTLGTASGLFGRSESTAGRGVFGLATATSGNTRGLFGRSDSSAGHGVLGYATSTIGFVNGVRGMTDSSDGRGVFGEANATSGVTNGVLGLSHSPGGFGGHFYNDAGGVGLLAATTDNPDGLPLKVQGAVGQAENLQEWMNASGAVLASVSPTGTFTGPGSGLTDLSLSALQSGSAASGQVLKWNGSAWAPGGDSDSGGTVMSVNTGAGLTGGPISVTGTVSVATGGISQGMIANGAVGSAQIANGAVGAAQINQAQVQARVSATCSPGQYLRGINADGSVVCEPIFAPPVITAVDDPAYALGWWTSIAIGTDGLPVISYQDTGASALKVAHCGNPACTAGNSLSIVDAVLPRYTSIAIGTDGLPVVSYQDGFPAQALKVAHCGNAACTGGNTAVTVDDPANNVGESNSIAIGIDGLPVISYLDMTAGALKVAHCGNAACTTGNTITAVDDPANNVGWYTSIGIGTDGLPVISYYDSTAGALKVAHCGNATCTAGNSITTVDDPINNVGEYTSIAIGTDGLPVISYFDNTAGALKVAHCGNVDCTTGNTLTTVDDPPANNVGQFTSIAIGTDGLPVISYYDSTAGALKVVHCGNAACTSGNRLTTVDDPVNSVGWWISIAVGTDGLPVISYQDGTAGTLKVAKCGTRTCQ